MHIAPASRQTAIEKTRFLSIYSVFNGCLVGIIVAANSYMRTTLERETLAPQPKPAVKSGEGIKFDKSVTINRPISEVFAFWRNLENLPSFMKHLDAVTVIDDRVSHWVVSSSPNHSFGWDAEITEDRVDEIIAWRSLPDSDVQNAGSVRFSEAPGNRGTVVKLTLKYSPPGGKFGAMIAKVFGKDAQRIIAEDLFRMKSLLETGEVPTVAGQSHGQRN